MDRYASQGDLPSCFRPCEPLARRSLLGNFDLKEGPSHTLSVVLLLQERTQKQWRWLLIDEYQDCNPLQAGTVGGDYGFVCLRECLVHVELVPCMGNNESTSTRLCAQVGTWQVQFIHVKGVSREQGRKVRIANILQQERGHITVVGDDAQSIYRFRGALAGVFQAFQDTYDRQGMLSTSLVLNYREGLMWSASM
eukprot:scaffold70662_cov13-Tisochrysis_lutea.AAC.1